MMMACGKRSQKRMEVWLSLAGSDEESERRRTEVYGGVEAVLGGKERWRDGRMLMCAEATVHTLGVAARDQSEAMAAVGSAEWVLMEVDAQSRACMIGLENVISAARGSGTRVAAGVSRADEVNGAAFALDVGADALVLPPPVGDDDPLWEAATIARAQRRERADADGVSKTTTDERRKRGSALRAAQVRAVVPGVVADRVAIDTVRLLRPGEGALVGSSSQALALVHAETLPSALVACRPFRVNAGPVHAYVLLWNGTCKYLSELNAGDVIHITDAGGESRPVAVGRLKIETRPHLRVDFAADVDGPTYQIFLQQAETVRLVRQIADGHHADGQDDPLWEPVSVVDLEPGHRVAASFADGFGTHCGASIDARVVER